MEKIHKAFDEHVEKYNGLLDGLLDAIEAGETVKDAILSFISAAFWAGVEAMKNEQHEE